MRASPVGPRPVVGGVAILCQQAARTVYRPMMMAPKRAGENGVAGPRPTLLGLGAWPAASQPPPPAAPGQPGPAMSRAPIRPAGRVLSPWSRPARTSGPRPGLRPRLLETRAAVHPVSCGPEASSPSSIARQAVRPSTREPVRARARGPPLQLRWRPPPTRSGAAVAGHGQTARRSVTSGGRHTIRERLPQGRR